MQKNDILKTKDGIYRILKIDGDRVLAIDCQKRTMPKFYSLEFFDRAEKTGNTMEIKKYVMVKADGVVAKALRDSYHKLPVSLYSPMMHAFAGITKFVPHGLCLKVMKLFK
mgnify:CR=1 FL=1